MKAERTHFGTLFEINAQREFEFEGGDSNDYRIAGRQVDAKWTQTCSDWMQPPEVLHDTCYGTGRNIVRDGTSAYWDDFDRMNRCDDLGRHHAGNEVWSPWPLISEVGLAPAPRGPYPPS